jgi:Fe-S cluster assembly protein SufB
MRNEQDFINTLLHKEYPHGQAYDIEQRCLPRGLTQDTIREISRLRYEPEFMLDFRLQAYDILRTKSVPQWSSLNLPDLDLDSLCYFSEIIEGSLTSTKLYDMMQDLGVQANNPKLTTEFVLDSTSVFNNLHQQYSSLNIIVCSISQAIQNHPELIKRYLGSVVPASDNYFSALNAAVFSDGTFVYIPEGVSCPFDISTYFRLNTKGLGQFERTLIIAENGSSVSYLEGCTAPAFSEHQLHAAVVEIIALDHSTVSYSTIQNWYPGDKNGVGGVYNFVTKRGLAHQYASITWTQVETGAAVTWKYPSVVLLGKHSQGHFNSIAITKYAQQADTGTKMTHIGEGTVSSIVAKSIVAGSSSNTYRGRVAMTPSSIGARSYSSCDSLILGKHARSHTYPVIVSGQKQASIEHEATTVSISAQQLIYLAQRGLGEREASILVVKGFCKSILSKLPLEFAIEAQQLLNLCLFDAIG